MAAEKVNANKFWKDLFTGKDIENIGNLDNPLFLAGDVFDYNEDGHPERTWNKKNSDGEFLMVRCINEKGKTDTQNNKNDWSKTSKKCSKSDDKCDDKCDYKMVLHPNDRGEKRPVRYFTERGVYKYLLQSRADPAKPFVAIVCDKLENLRLHGKATLTIEQKIINVSPTLSDQHKIIAQLESVGIHVADNSSEYRNVGHILLHVIAEHVVIDHNIQTYLDIKLDYHMEAGELLRKIVTVARLMNVRLAGKTRRKMNGLIKCEQYKQSITTRIAVNAGMIRGIRLAVECFERGDYSPKLLSSAMFEYIAEYILSDRDYIIYKNRRELKASIRQTKLMQESSESRDLLNTLVPMLSKIDPRLKDIGSMLGEAGQTIGDLFRDIHLSTWAETEKKRYDIILREELEAYDRSQYEEEQDEHDIDMRDQAAEQKQRQRRQRRQKSLDTSGADNHDTD